MQQRSRSSAWASPRSWAARVLAQRRDDGRDVRAVRRYDVDGWKRRDVLIGMGGGFLLVELPAAAVAKKGKPKKEEAEVAPAEDLMREHGVLRRGVGPEEQAPRPPGGGGEGAPGWRAGGAGGRPEGV